MFCKCKKFNDCHCKVKGPIRERYFLVDQRTVRKMAISNVKKVNQLLHNNMKRRAIQSSRLENYSYADDIMGKSKNIFNFQSTCKIKTEKPTSFENSGNISEELLGIKTSDTYISSESYYTCTSKKRFKLCNLNLEFDRIGVSDRSASLIVNAVLKDFHIVTKENPARIVD